MKVIVCGGRDYANVEMLNLVLDELHAKTPISVLIQGGAAGADELAFRWFATKPGMHGITHYADWKKHGRAAGPIRNARMLEEAPDVVVAFPGGRGTANMIKQAKAAGVPVIEVEE
ncbi:DUF2493 domain-containing protein [Paraburkholderia phenoliruptrix]|jgi:predicted polyphosphate/ATP-dependent NAD kinase|uniref:DUF2493 domain-containing protein n=1 Tax=Paraburkholderia phenoliruptrix TaxID=252970 RepID=UPI002854531D|nr:SLOG family protein [Paraburkholderia phenoliruptrix]MDR6389207.1 putative polyphosphate/ATP-dependent NAD kinase [Paraburkholderia phenoliruptrix]MDR6421300.1 putative polyphosphate/ATP-dependent NAD kinase [Paraburkholderia phenoliruptrix]